MLEQSATWRAPKYGLTHPKRRRITTADTGRLGAALLSYDDAARWIRVVPGGAGPVLRGAVAIWLAKHRRLLGVAVSLGVAAALIGSNAIPEVLLPFVVGPVVAVILTACVTPNGKVKRSS